MFRIAHKKQLNDAVYRMDFDAPFIARKARAGQFVIFRVDEQGERIPLTIADYDREKGTVAVIFQAVGKSTMLLAQKEEGDSIADLVGPLGNPTPLENAKKVAVIGGGVGCAIAYPVAKELHEAGVHVDMIAGFRSKDIIILEEDMKAASDRLFITTDDGTYGEKGLVTQVLQRLLDEGNEYDAVFAVGPVVMMKFVCATTKPYNVRTIVSLNPIMIDGTGMCGGCRVTVGGEIKFACVDGPDFDGHQVDFDELMKRNNTYCKREAEERKHPCRLFGGAQ